MIAPELLTVPIASLLALRVVRSLSPAVTGASLASVFSAEAAFLSLRAARSLSPAVTGAGANLASAASPSVGVLIILPSSSYCTSSRASCLFRKPVRVPETILPAVLTLFATPVATPFTLSTPAPITSPVAPTRVLPNIAAFINRLNPGIMPRTPKMPFLSIFFSLSTLVISLSSSLPSVSSP